MRRAVVTGIGAVTPLGNSFAESWRALLQGGSGIGPITRFAPADMPWSRAGELRDFRADDHIPAKDVLRLDPFVHYAAAAARMAAGDSGLGGPALEAAAVLMGSSRGGIGSLSAAVLSRATAFLMAGTTVSMAASYVSKLLGAKGPVLGISNACASGANAVGEALRLIRGGQADVVLAGGAEAPLAPVSFGGYGAAGALSREGVMRPFDRRRDGFVLSEGAAVLVLEEHAAALKRGASIYGEVLGYGNTSDAFHMTVPDPESQARAMRAALGDAGLGEEAVGYINAHATATPLGDRTEAASIARVFGPSVAVSATKSVTGHMLGASGAFEAAVALMCVHSGTLPPTANLGETDCDLGHVRQARRESIGAALSNSFGFGGVNAVLVLGKAPG
jgi:3-oxoacyl-[acyl-carrier-protein] synthase II